MRDSARGFVSRMEKTVVVGKTEFFLTSVKFFRVLEEKSRG